MVSAVAFLLTNREEGLCLAAPPQSLQGPERLRGGLVYSRLPYYNSRTSGALAETNE